LILEEANGSIDADTVSKQGKPHTITSTQQEMLSELRGLYSRLGKHSTLRVI